MDYEDYALIPNIGIKNIKIGENIKDVIRTLEDEKIEYQFEIDNHPDSESEIPWKILTIANYMTFSFAHDLLWKIDLNENFKGGLKNGIKIGMTIEEAIKIDETIEFDDWSEVFISKEMYILEVDLLTHKIFNIAIGIKEVIKNDLDAFYSYEWVKRYKK